MKRNLIAVCAVLLLAGCASFSTTQKDISYEQGQKVREITTTAKARTLIESKSALAQFQATQTDKTQSAKVGSLSQESAVSTNMVGAVEAITRGIVEGVVKGVKP